MTDEQTPAAGTDETDITAVGAVVTDGAYTRAPTITDTAPKVTLGSQ